MLRTLIQDKITKLIPKFKVDSDKLICLSLDNAGLNIAYIEQKELQWCEFIACSKKEDFAEVLLAFIDQRHLNNFPCNWMLNTGDYKLLTLESLPVAPAELANALRWHIKDLISFPAEQSVIEVFEAPFSSGFGKKNNIQVAVADRNYLQHTADIINNCGLKLSVIDIPELAIRNITALFNEDEQGIGLIWIRPAATKLTFTKNKSFYITREFDLELVDLFTDTSTLTQDNQSKIEILANEIRRSLDYYQSQLRQTPPAKLLISPIKPAALDYLKTLVLNDFQVLNLSTLLPCKQPINDELQTKCLTVIGGALRQEK